MRHSNSEIFLGYSINFKRFANTDRKYYIDHTLLQTSVLYRQTILVRLVLR